MDLKDIINKTCKEAPKYGNLEESALAHAEEYGINDIDLLFPDPENLTKEPLFISRRMEWVNYFMGNISKRPFGRTKAIYADITDDDARAIAYTKGTKKKDEIISLLKRITEPTTIYKKQGLDRDNIIDITDVDVVTWIRSEMRMMLEEEIARACLLGDGRPEYSDDHISSKNIRPILFDDDLYVIKKTYPFENLSMPLKYNRSFLLQFIEDSIRQHAYYEGSGILTMFINRTLLVKLLLLTDEINRRLFPAIEDLANGLMVNKIIPVDLFDTVINIDEKPIKPLSITLDLNDYILGMDQNGATATYDKFDIDYNKYKYLIETRCSGCLYRPHSAMTICMENAVPVPIDIEVTKLPDKVIYKTGEKLNTTGLIISELYSDGSKKKINNYELSPFDSSTEGEKTIYVTTDKFKTSFVVTVQNEMPKTIKITKNPDKMIYDIGEQFDRTGMIVVAVKTSGEEYPITSYNIYGFDSSTEGEKEVTIVYQGLDAKLTVTVKHKVATKILITKNPDKMIYNIGDKFDRTGMVVTAYYDDGSERPIDDYSVSGFDSSTVGEKDILIKYRELETHLIITVQDGTPISIKITKLPTKTIYTIGESFDPTGLEVTAYYRSGASIKINDYTITGFESETAGTKHILVSYNNLTDSFDVVVKGIMPLEEIHIIKLPNGTYYESGETLVSDGMIIEGTDSDGHKRILQPDEYQITPTTAPEVQKDMSETTITVNTTKNNKKLSTTFNIMISRSGYTSYVYIHNFEELKNFLETATPDKYGICKNIENNVIKNPNPGDNINVKLTQRSERNSWVIVDLRNTTIDLNNGRFYFDAETTYKEKEAYVGFLNGTIKNGSGSKINKVGSEESLFTSGGAVFDHNFISDMTFRYNLINMNIKENIGAGCPIINGSNSVLFINTVDHFTLPKNTAYTTTFENNSVVNSSLLTAVRFVPEHNIIFRHNLVHNMGVTDNNPILYHGLVYIGYNGYINPESFFKCDFTFENNKILDQKYNETNTIIVWDALKSASYVTTKKWIYISINNFTTNKPIGIVLDGVREVKDFTSVIRLLGGDELGNEVVSGDESRYTFTKGTVDKMPCYGLILKS